MSFAFWNMEHHLLIETELMDWSTWIFVFPYWYEKKKITADICMSEKMYAYGPGKFNLFINLWTLELVFGGQALKWTEDG